MIGVNLHLHCFLRLSFKLCGFHMCFKDVINVYNLWNAGFKIIQQYVRKTHICTSVWWCYICRSVFPNFVLSLKRWKRWVCLGADHWEWNGSQGSSTGLEGALGPTATLKCCFRDKETEWGPSSSPKNEKGQCWVKMGGWVREMLWAHIRKDPFLQVSLRQK